MPLNLIFRNASCPPDIDRIRRCAVCGFAGNPNTLVEGEVSLTSYVTTGSTYDDPDPENVDLVVDSTQTSPANCAFCGTPRPYTGRRGDL